MKPKQTDSFAKLHKALGAPKKRVVPPESFFKGTEATVDQDLVLLWRQDGWAQYGNGLFWTVDPRDFAEVSQEWPVVPQGALVFGRNAFADLYLVYKGQVLRLDVQWNRTAELGPNTYVFVNATLEQQEFQDVILHKDLFEIVRRQLGDISADECYGLFPGVPLGGDESDPNAYRRVRLREYLALLAQGHG